MRILALDISTVAIGWAYEKDGLLVEHGALQPESTSAPIDKRLESLRARLEALVRVTLKLDENRFHEETVGRTKRGKPITKTIYDVKVLIEGGMVYRSREGSMSLGGAIHLARNLFFRLGIPVEEVNVTSWKRALCGFGAAKKEQIRAEVECAGFSPQTEDEADAIGMLLGWSAMREVA